MSGLRIADWGLRIADGERTTDHRPPTTALDASSVGPSAFVGPKSAIRNPQSAILEWRVHLARQAPGKAASAVLGALAAGALAAAASGNALLALGAVGVVIGAVAEFLFPVHYRLTDQGAEVRFGLSRSLIAWDQVRRCTLFPDGLKLSPLPAPSRLESFRGIFLRFADNMEEVLEFVKEARDAARH